MAAVGRTDIDAMKPVGSIAALLMVGVSALPQNGPLARTTEAQGAIERSWDTTSFGVTYALRRPPPYHPVWQSRPHYRPEQPSVPSRNSRQGWNGVEDAERINERMLRLIQEHWEKTIRQGVGDERIADDGVPRGWKLRLVGA